VASRCNLMPRTTSRSWTPEQIDFLRSSAETGVSVSRTSVVLKRSVQSVQTKAREIGAPFPTMHQVRRKRLADEAKALSAEGLPLP